MLQLGILPDKFTVHGKDTLVPVYNLAILRKYHQVSLSVTKGLLYLRSNYQVL